MKICAILPRVKGERSQVSHYFRMGKESGEKPRPIKIILKSVEHTREILKNSKNLNDLNLDIYLKPDKTKAESEEFKRLGKRKADLLKDHPTTDPRNPVVVLEKGVLRVNGLEVDRYKPIQSIF